MWRLLPKPWFNRRKPADRVNAAAFDLLRDDWRSRLVDACRSTLGEDLSQEQAIRLLPTLSGPQLLDLDPALRVGQWRNDRIPDSRKAALAEIGADHEESAAYLFVAACDASGFVRQRALEAFRHYPSDVAMSAALIRCDDWVPEVRSAALQVLDALLAENSPVSIFTRLDIVVRLRRRQRFGVAAWASTIDHVLRSRYNREQLRRWVGKGPWDARKLALELIASEGAEARSEAVRQAIHDKDLRIALWGLAHVTSDPESSDGDLLREAARHPAAPVRAAAMRLGASAEATVALSLVMQGLLDLASGPRTAAAYVLQHRFGRSPLDAWRAALLEQKGHDRLAALLGLCDSGTADDISRIAAHTQHRNARIRAAVLAGLWRIGANDLATHLERALWDPSRLVVRRALDVYGRSSEILDPALLGRVLASAEASTIKTLIGGTRLIDRWEGLRLLLEVANSSNPLIRSSARGEIQRWVTGVNRRFTTPRAAILEEITKQLSTIRTTEDTELWRQLATIVTSGA